MKKTLIISLLLICLSGQSQEFFHSNGYAFQGSKTPLIEKDNSGKLISTGGFTTSVMIGGSLISGNASQANSYIIKHTPGGNVDWYKTMYAENSGSQDQASILALSVDVNDNIYLAVEYFGTLNFDGNTYPFQASDIAIIKLNAMGTTQWVKRIGETSGFDRVYDMDIDSNGNVNISGKASTTGFSFNNTSPNSSFTGFLAQLSSTGNENWIHYFDGVGMGYGKIATNSTNDIFMSFGYDKFSSQNFTVGNTTIDVSTANGNSNAIVKFSSTGTGLSAMNYVVNSTSEFIVCSDLEVNVNNELILLYELKGDVTIDTTIYTSAGGNSSNPLLVELDATLSENWATLISSANEFILYDLDVSLSNTYLVGGYLFWNVTINNELYTPAGQREGILIAITDDGAPIKAQMTGGTGNDVIRKLAVFNKDSIFSATTFQGNITLSNNQTITNSGNSAFSNAVVKHTFDDCIIDVPDVNLRNALLAHGNTIVGIGISNIDTDNSGTISCTEAAAYSGKLDLSGQNISDVTGLEAYTNVTQLNIGQNSLNSIDFTMFGQLNELVASNNQLTSIDLSQNTLLTRLDLGFNSFTLIDVSQNSLLTYLQVRDNQISTIDLASLSSLQEAYVYNNNFTSLDFSNNEQLTRIEAGNNMLTNCNVANGNNAAITYFYISNNPNLTCIQHDANFDPVTTNNNWQKDATAGWSINCSQGILVTSIDVQGSAGSTSIGFQSGTLQMVASVLPVNATDNSYTWSVASGTGTATISSSGLLTALTNGIVTVKAIANDGSGVFGTMDVTISNQTSVGINKINTSIFSIFPNPSSSLISVKGIGGELKVRIVDLKGQVVLNPKEINNIDISNIKSGIYFVSVQTHDHTYNLKLIKE